MWFWNFIEKSIPNQTNPHSGKPTSSGFRLGGQAVNPKHSGHSPSEGQACWVPEGSGQAVPTIGMLSYWVQFFFKMVNHLLHLGRVYLFCLASAINYLKSLFVFLSMKNLR